MNEKVRGYNWNNILWGRIMKLDKIIIVTFFSSVICLIMYLITAIVMAYIDNINLHEEGVGVLAIMGYFIIPFITLYSLDIKEKN